MFPARVFNDLKKTNASYAKQMEAAMIRTVLAGTNCLSYKRWIWLALSFVAFSECAWSQTQLATVFGAIIDPSGAIIPEAAVINANQSTGLT